MRASKKALVAAAFGAASLLHLPPATAQTAPTAPAQTQAPQTAAPSPAISDRKLDAAAAALQQVQSLKKSYQQKMATAAPADQPRIAGEANDALTKAVTDHGLSIDEYNSILKVAQNDANVRDKLLQRVNRSGQ